MAGFCAKCFSTLDENGLCPVCGYRAPAAAAPATAVANEISSATVAYEPSVSTEPPVRFCVQCGGSLDENGLCPVCDAPATPATPAATFCMQCGGTLDDNGSCPACDAPAAPAATFCMQCGGALDENGSCPVCDAPAAPAATFCMQCGGALDENGSCPVCNAPAAPIAAPSVAPTKQKKKTSALSVIATVLLSICLFVTMLLSVGIATVRNTVSKGGFNKLADEIDVALLLQETDMANSREFNEFYRRIERDYGIQLTDEKLAELLEDSTVPEYISDKVDEFSDDFFKGDAELVITKEEMIDLVRENERLLEREMPQELGQNLTYEDHEVIANWLFNGDELVLVSTDTLQKESSALYQMANIGLSYLALAFFLLLSAIIGFVMCRNSLSQAAIGGGVVFLLLGGLTALAAAVVAWIPGLWNSLVGGNWILSTVGAVLSANGWIFTILLVLGLAMLITRTVVKHSRKNKA